MWWAVTHPFLKVTPEKLNHTQRVTRAYRRLLREGLSTTIHRDEFNEVAHWVRGMFEENRNLKKQEDAVAAIEKAEEYIRERQHIQPYKFLNSPGGTLFMRDSPFPKHVLLSDPYDVYVSREEQEREASGDGHGGHH
eukprot:GILK01000925.1.p1 GENE.GILK01000925.1~~GILK01000925.1.p1  ORF type:complete len:137 (+),score=25.09 GILK01000925.1:46-456(+)